VASVVAVGVKGRTFSIVTAAKAWACVSPTTTTQKAIEKAATCRMFPLIPIFAAKPFAR